MEKACIDSCFDYIEIIGNRKENIMFQSKVFDYVNVLDRAADASWMRNEAIGNNLSNVDTPGYKRQDVAFEDVLRQALGKSTYRSMDADRKSVV